MQYSKGSSLLFFALLLISTSAWAQQAATDAATATQAIAAIYQLDEAQAAKLLKTQENHFRNLEEIAPLAASDKGLYVSKRQALRDHADQALFYLLNEGQRTIYQQQIAERRRADAALIKTMRTQGADNMAIQEALLGIE